MDTGAQLYHFISKLISGGFLFPWKIITPAAPMFHLWICMCENAEFPVSVGVEGRSMGRVHASAMYKHMWVFY